MSSTGHSEEGHASHSPKRRRRGRWWFIVLAMAIVLWQLKAVIWGVHGMVRVLEAGEGPRVFLVDLLTRVYHAVVTTINTRTR